MADEVAQARYGSASRLWSMVAAIVLVLVGAVGAWRAAVTGADFMFDLEQSRSALARSEPQVLDAGTPRLAERVVLVIVDGLRLDSSKDMSYLAALRERGIAGHARSHYPTWSRPNYVSILTGVPPQASGVRTNRHYTPVLIDTLMDRARDAHLRTAWAGEFSPMPALFLRAADPAHQAMLVAIDIDAMLSTRFDELPMMPELELRSPFDDARYTPWPGGLVDALRGQLSLDFDLHVVLISVVDNAGHREGADSDEYRAAVQVADRTLRRVASRFDLDRDAVIIVADHGHTDSGGHGGMEPEVVMVPLVMGGAGIRAGAVPRDARLVDIAPTVAALLGMPAPGHGLGRTLVETLTLSPDHAAARQAADAARLAVTEKVVRDSRASTLLEELAHRSERLLAVGANGAALILLAWWLHRRRGVRFSWRAVLFGVPAFFVVYYATIAALGQQFSPSFLPATGHIALELFRYGLIGVVVHVVVGWLVLHKRHNLADRLALANGNALIGFGLTMVPAGLMWAFFPPPYVEVPGPTMLVLLPAVQVALALYAIAVLLALIVEVVVFFARALDPQVRLARLERATARVKARLDADQQGITLVRADGSESRHQRPSLWRRLWRWRRR